ncbi:MAG TPA: hypothetical protein PK413_13830 [Thermoanaerobaculia bacterium]|nr:hypothetical protein [Thermoanaerobaculia bacterium]
MRKNGPHHTCSIKKRESERRAQAAYRVTPKGRATSRRYESTRVRVGVAGSSTTIRVPPEHRETIVMKLADFRAGQRQTYREAADGGFNQTES